MAHNCEQFGYWVLRGDASKASSSYLFNLAMASTGKFYCGFAFLYIILMYLDFFNSLKS